MIAVHPYRDLWRRIRPDDYQTHLSKLEMELPAFTQAVTAAHEARVTEYGGRIGADESLPMLVSNVNRLRQYYTEVGAYAPGAPTPAQPPAPYAPAPATLTATASGEDAVDLSWGPVTGAAAYRVQHRESGEEPWGSLDDSATGTTHAASRLWCGRTHEFRVGAYGDGTTHNTRVGFWSSTATAMTDACSPQPPRFEEDSYAFEVSAAATVGYPVGMVSAIDVNGDTVAYSITAGNEAGKFRIDASTGEITVAARLGSAIGTTYTLTVGASDSVSGTNSVTVTITVAAVDCSGGTAVLDADDEPALVGDCEALLGLRDALAGAATLDWSLDTPIASWDGVTVSGTPQRVTKLNLTNRRLTGVVPSGLAALTSLEELRLGRNSLRGEIPGQLGDLADLRVIYLRYNRLTGEIPVELGSLSRLTILRLNGNELTGAIPPELGDLSALEDLALAFNGLTGPIPPELRGLTRLRQLWAASNQLDGPIPPELGTLANLETLRLSRNRLSGAVPWELGELRRLRVLELSRNSLEGCLRPSLRSIGSNDLAALRLSDCTEDGRVPSPSGLSVTLADGAFTITWSAVTGAAEYEAQYRLDGPDDEWASLPATSGTTLTYTPTDAPHCESIYQFRVRAYGDASTYAAGWSVESTVESVMSASCNQDPAFDPDSYSFEVREDGAVDHVVGTVLATDADEGDTVSYSITSGNGDGKFTLGSGTGEIAVAGGLDYEMVSSYTLTVEASDGNGGTDTATVAVAVTDVAEDPPPAPSDVGVTLAGGTFTITWTDLDGAARYDAQHKTDAAGSQWTALPETTGVSVTYTPDVGPACGTTYQFRVRAYGDGDAYTEMWGSESEPASVTTGACNRDPEFTASTYSFTIAENAAASASVGTVSATDPDDGDTVTYSITAGNEDGKFAITRGTGQITVAGDLNPDELAFYALTVVAGDGRGGTAAAAVNIGLILSECSNGTAVTRPAENPELVRDCSMLLSAQDTLAGDGSLDWSADVPIGSWQGVYVRESNPHSVVFTAPWSHVRDLLIPDEGLTGSIPPELGGLEDLLRIDLQRNQLTGGIPVELGRLSRLRTLSLYGNGLSGGIHPVLGNLPNLEDLRLNRNQLTGEMPSELAGLGSLRILILNSNRLSGGIPSWLGELSSLRQLWLRDNQLTGSIPSELEGLDLQHLHLSGNSFTGCIPAGLRDIANNDLDRLQLDYCN